MTGEVTLEYTLFNHLFQKKKEDIPTWYPLFSFQPSRLRRNNF